MAFSPDGQWLVSVARSDAAALNMAQDREEIRLPPHDAEISSVAFSPDGRTLVSGSWTAR